MQQAAGLEVLRSPGRGLTALFPKVTTASVNWKAGRVGARLTFQRNTTLLKISEDREYLGSNHALR